jgi:hypothetical protein
MDVFVRDRVLGVTVLASVATNGTQGDQDSIEPALSADGRHVAFSSDAQNFLNPRTSGESNVYVRDLDEATLSCITVLPDGTEPNGQSHKPVRSSRSRRARRSSSRSTRTTPPTSCFSIAAPGRSRRSAPTASASPPTRTATSPCSPPTGCASPSRAARPT